MRVDVIEKRQNVYNMEDYYIKKMADAWGKNTNKSVLCFEADGSKTLLGFISKGFEVFIVDKNQTLSGFAEIFKKHFKEKIKYEIGDVIKIPYDDQVVQNVFVGNMSKLLDGKNKIPSAISEIQRVLVPGGNLFAIINFGKNSEIINEDTIPMLFDGFNIISKEVSYDNYVITAQKSGYRVR